MIEVFRPQKQRGMKLNESQLSRILKLRRQLHARPELAGQERQTALLLYQFFQGMKSWKITRDIGGHGMMATFSSRNKGPVIAFRAELDALCCGENNKAAHLCGHDGHMAILAALALMINDKPLDCGKVVLLFQPAEENGSGAQRMLDDRKLKTFSPDFIYALHNIPGEKETTVLVREGDFSSSVQSLVLNLDGQESHAAEPEKGINPVKLIGELIQLCSNLEEKDPAHPDYCQITITYVNAGKIAHGTAAGQGLMHMTFRTHDPDNMERVGSTFLQSAQRLARSHGIEAAWNWVEAFPSVSNDPLAVEKLIKAAKGSGLKLKKLEYPYRWGEDFGHFSRKFPSAMAGIGAGKKTAPLHSIDYHFPDMIIETAASLLYQLIPRNS